MDSRIKENPETTFDLVIQVKCQASENEDPVVLWKFPEDFGDQEVLQSIPKFCFPFDIARAQGRYSGPTQRDRSNVCVTACQRNQETLSGPSERAHAKAFRDYSRNYEERFW